MIVFLSVPMQGRTDEQIEAVLDHLSDKVHKEFGANAVIDGRSEGVAGAKHKGVWLLGKALCNLSVADAAYFADGWQEAKGCCVEHLTCEKYGIEILRD